MKKKEQIQKKSDNQPQLPKSWKWVRLGEVVSLEYGKALKKEVRNDNGKIPVYGSNGIVGYHNESLIDESAIIVGRKGAAGEVHLSQTSFWPIDTTYYVKKRNNFDLKFFYHLLKTLNLRSLDRSTAIPGLNRDDAYAILIPLPPISEQQRIVARIEEKFSEIDHGIEKLKLIHDQIKMYRQSVLKAAFEGKLISEVETPTKPEAFESLNKSDATVISKKQIASLTEKEVSELPIIPKNWKWVKLGEVCEKIFDGTHFSPKSYAAGEYKYITAKNIKENRIDLTELTYVTEDVHRKIYSRSDVKKGDILYIKDGATTGIASVNYLDEEFSLLSSVGVFRVDQKKINPKFLSYFLNAEVTRNRMLKKVAGVAITRLTLIKLINSEFIVVPISVQDAIVSAIELRFSKADALEKVVEESLKNAERTKQSILKKAFRGELSEQIETDENVEEMLKQISQEKERLVETKRVNPKKEKIEVIPMEETLKQKFKDISFSFEDIQKIYGDMDYDELREKLFELLDRDNFVRSYFDEKAEAIKFKLV